MKIYLAGPMRGYPYFNFPAFDAAAAKLRAAGHEVFSPADNDRKIFGLPPDALISADDEAGYANSMGMTAMELRRRVFLDDVTYICQHAEAVALLPKWDASKGAFAEHALGRALGLWSIET